MLSRSKRFLRGIVGCCKRNRPKSSAPVQTVWTQNCLPIPRQNEGILARRKAQRLSAPGSVLGRLDWRPLPVRPRWSIVSTRHESDEPMSRKGDTPCPMPNRCSRRRAKARAVRESAAKQAKRAPAAAIDLTGDAGAIAPRIYDNVRVEMATGVIMARLRLWQASGWPLWSFFAYA